MITIAFLFYPNTTADFIKWPTVPEKGSFIYFKNKCYQVSKVNHFLDKNGGPGIQVQCMPSNEF